MLDQGVIDDMNIGHGRLSDECRTLAQAVARGATRLGSFPSFSERNARLVSRPDWGHIPAAVAGGGKPNMNETNAAAAEADLPPITLADRFDLAKTSVLLTGAQAVARLLIAQKARDRRDGFNTGGFVSGYRGSPVGGLDLQFTKLKALFKANDIHFEPGLNEELAATALWGAQQARNPRRRQVRTACSGFGTARGRELTAAATYSDTPISPAPRRAAACSR